MKYNNVVMKHGSWRHGTMAMYFNRCHENGTYKSVTLQYFRVNSTDDAMKNYSW
jgi:hypothetical protein